MDELFHPALVAILAADHPRLRSVLMANSELASKRSSCGHPTLLQMVACEARNLPDAVGSAKVLLDCHAPMQDPLVAAASVSARPVLDLLLAHGADIAGDGHWGPLDEAVYWAHRGLVAHLVKRGAPVTTLRAASGVGGLGGVGSFFEGTALRPNAGPVRSPFSETITDAVRNDAQAVLDNAFVTACLNGHVDVAELLLAKGASINGKPPGFHWRGTALHAAAWQGHEPMVDWLLSRGAKPSITDDHVGSDAIGWARHHRHPAIEDRLRREDVNPG